MTHSASTFLLTIICAGNLFAQSNPDKTEIMVLGTPHLSQISGFNPEMLDEVVTKLGTYEFDAICIENMPGELLYDIRSRNDSAFIDLIEGFGGERLVIADSAQIAFKISFLEAEKNILNLLDKKELSEEDHLMLIKNFSATADLASATLHYKYLVEKSALQTTGFENELKQIFEKNINSANENYSLASRLAFNRKLRNLESIDNFQDEPNLHKYFPSFYQDFMDNQDLFKDLPNLPVFVKMNDHMELAVEKNDLLDFYYFLNNEEYMDQDYEAQWAIWLRTNFPSGSDRARYSLWEMRNLQITANILKVAAFYPGKRLLVIIGSSHKSFIEKYLKQVHDIELLEFK